MSGHQVGTWQKTREDTLKMQFCGSLFVICLLATHVSERNARHLAVPRQHGELDVSTWPPHAVARPDSEKTQSRRAEADNDVKRKTGLSRNTSPLDRLSSAIDRQRSELAITGGQEEELFSV
ncbi:uncharacterized protein LOC144083626 [Stigmatopora argus]